MIDAVAQAIREVAEAVVRPRFRSLSAGEVEEKSPGDYVTIADKECEIELSKRLAALRDVPVLGEEAAAADPSLIDRLTAGEAAWIVDPVDGTSNFASGSPDHAVMVALAEGDLITHSWIFQPEHDRMFAAERGSGAVCNGERLHMAAPPSDRLQGIVKRKYLPDDQMRTLVTEVISSVGTMASNPGCSGVEYPQVVEGVVDYLLYWRTYPWDHAPGALIVEESGGAARRPDGSHYRWNDGADGLIVAHADLAPELGPRFFPDSGSASPGSAHRSGG